MFSLVSIKTAEDFKELGKLPKQYLEQLDNQNIPSYLKDLLMMVFNVLLQKINVPQDEIDDLLEKIDERGINEMLLIENYDVQETRRQARAEAERQRDEAYRQREEAYRRAVEEQHRATEANRRAEAEQRRAEAEQNRAMEADRRLKLAIKTLIKKGNTVTEVAAIMHMTEQDIEDAVLCE